MPESSLNCRFRGTTLPYEELLIALENITIDKVTAHSVSKVEKIDTSAPMEIGMTAGTDGEEACEGGYMKASQLAVQAVWEPKVDGMEDRVRVGAYRNTSTAAKVRRERIELERGQWSETGGKKGGKGQEKGDKGETGVCWSCGKTAHIAINSTKGSWNKSLIAVEEDKGNISEEVHEDGDELHAWCLLEESDGDFNGKTSPARNQN